MSNLSERCWYHLSAPMDWGSGWPDAHLYEVTEGTPQTELTDAERFNLIRSVREHCTIRRWDPRMSLGGGGGLRFRVADKVVNLCFLTIQQEQAFNADVAASRTH